MVRFGWIVLLQLLLSPILSASPTSKCLEGIPNDENWIVSGGALHNVVQCLENTSSQSKPSEAAALNVTLGDMIPVIKYDSASYIQPNVFKNADTVSTLYIQFVNQIKQEKIITITFMDDMAQKVFELTLKSKDKTKEKIDLSQIKQLPKTYSGYILIHCTSDSVFEPLVPIIYSINSKNNQPKPEM